MRRTIVVGVLLVGCRGGDRGQRDGLRVASAPATVDSASSRGGAGDAADAGGGSARDGGDLWGAMDELLNRLAREESPESVVGVLGDLERRGSTLRVVRPRGTWLAAATLTMASADGAGPRAIAIELELARPIAIASIASGLAVQAAPRRLDETSTSFVADYGAGSVEVRAELDGTGPGDVTAALARGLVFRWTPADDFLRRYRPLSRALVVDVLADRLRTGQAPDVIEASLGLRHVATGPSLELVPRPAWLAGGRVTRAAHDRAVRTTVELELAWPMAVPELVAALDLEPVGGASTGTFAPKPGSLIASEGSLNVSLTPARVTAGGADGPQRLMLTWEAFDHPRVAPPPPSIVASRWYIVVRDVQRRFVRGDSAASIEAWLEARRRKDDVASGARLRQPRLVDVGARAASDARVADEIELSFSPAIGAADVVAGLGHHEEWTPIHGRDDPEDIAFDPIVTPAGRFRVIAMMVEPGTSPPAGTVDGFRLTWEPVAPPLAGHGRSTKR